MENLIDRTLEHLKARREKVLNGGVNCIPSPFSRFRSDFVGIEQKKYYLITAHEKSGKTQMFSFCSYTLPWIMHITIQTK